MNNIENKLSNFINKAKDLFGRMIIARKQSKFKEEMVKKNQGQLYNYCNNNFFYYSNGPTNLNTNSNYFTKILNHGPHRKMNYKSPANKKINISNTKISFHNYTQNSYSKFSKDPSKIISSDNSASKEFNKKFIIPKLNVEKKVDKDDLIKNILNLLKQLNQFHSNIFYETEEAHNYKNILNKILSELNKLINILSKEKVESNIKCLTERKQNNAKEPNNLLNNNKKYENIIKNIENYKKKYTRLHKRFNKSCNNINSRNPFNQRKYFSSIQNIKSRNESLYEKKQRTKSENSNDKKEYTYIPIKQNIKNIREILFKEGINDINNNKELNLKFIEKEQQTDNIIEEQI